MNEKSPKQLLQDKRFRRHGISLTRATMSNWLIKVAMLCQPLLPLIKQEIRSRPLINADESSFQVMKEQNRKNTSKSYKKIIAKNYSSLNTTDNDVV